MLDEANLAARRGRITASNVGAILGHSPFATRADVMRRMVREWHGAEPEFAGNIATAYGERNEATARLAYEIETGNTVDDSGFIASNDDNWAGCTPDGMIGLTDNESGWFSGEFSGLEIKCPFGLRKGGEFKPLADQPHYYDQVQFSIWVTSADSWDFYQWAPGTENAESRSKLERVYPDKEWQAENLPKLRAFWKEYCTERELPAAEKHLLPLHEPRANLEASPGAAQWIAEYDDLTAAIEAAEKRKRELLARIVEAAGSKGAVICGRKLTQVTRKGAIAYARAVKEHLPELDLEPYRGESVSYWKLQSADTTEA